MVLDLDAVGVTAGPRRVEWTDRDTLLYALAVGAGQEDPLAELSLTTENCESIRQQVLPTFALGLIHYEGPRVDIGPVDPAQRLHAEQAIEWSGTLPASGAATVTTTVSAIHDKGSGALVVFDSELCDAATGEWLARSRSGSFIRGAGGFGGDRAPQVPTEIPERPADAQLRCGSRPDQALLFRLCGDRNPLHADPAVARRGGFERPILHGLCTYGIAGRVLLAAVCDGDAGRVRSMTGRFTSVVLPGTPLTVRVWRQADGARFQVVDPGGAVVIDRGAVRHA